MPLSDDDNWIRYQESPPSGPKTRKKEMIWAVCDEDGNAAWVHRNGLAWILEMKPEVTSTILRRAESSPTSEFRELFVSVDVRPVLQESLSRDYDPYRGAFR